MAKGLVMRQLLISIVIPIYRSEGTLEELYQRIDNIFVNIDGDYELILVDDASTDNSWQIMKALRAKKKKVKIISLKKNFGQHNALMCGLHHSEGDYIITMDDDLQNPPEEIPKMIDAIRKSKNDVVYGVPQKKKHSFFRNAGSFLYRWLMYIFFKHDKKVRTSNFRIMSRHIKNDIILDRSPNPGMAPIIFNITNKISWIYVEHHKRVCGRTTYSLSKLIRQFLNLVLYYSNLPLRAIFLMGFISMLMSIIFSCYYLIKYLMKQITVPGWTTLVLLVLFFSGSIMLSLGIIGEYLLRIVQEVRWRPQFLIRDKDV